MELACGCARQPSCGWPDSCRGDRWAFGPLGMGRLAAWAGHNPTRGDGTEVAPSIMVPSLMPGSLLECFAEADRGYRPADLEGVGSSRINLRRKALCHTPSRRPWDSPLPGFC
jgi:hypothetical protein